MIHRVWSKMSRQCGAALIAVALVTINGCDNDPASVPPGSDAGAPIAHKHDRSGETCFICDPSLRDAGRLWCTEHGRYEDRCWLCHPEIEDKNRLYCKEHFLFEDECHLCHPELKKDPPPATGEDQAPSEPSARSIIDLFCNEHSVPEAQCAICQPALAASLQPGQSLKIRFVSKQSTVKAGVATARPIVADHAPAVRAYCEVRYNGNALARITPQAPGVVRRVLVDVGSSVKTGYVLAELDSPDLARAKSNYLATRQAVELAKIDLDRAQLIHDNTQEALALCEGELSLGELEALSALDLGLNRRDLLATHAQFVAAKADHERQTTLLDQKIGSKANHQAAEAAYRKAWAEYLAVRDDLAFGSMRDLEAKSRAHKSAQFDLESVRRQLLTVGLSESQITEVPTQASPQLARQHVRAPFDGTVIERAASVGEAVVPGDTVLIMADLSSMWLVLSIPPDLAALAKPGMQISCVLPDLAGATVNGELVWVDSSLHDRSRMVKARAVVANPDKSLKAGMFGEARIVIGEATKALRVPRDAVQEHEKRPYVFVKLEDDLYALRRVTVGIPVDGTVDIIKGLGPDEPVVVAGTFTVFSEFLKSRLGAGCVDD